MIKTKVLYDLRVRKSPILKDNNVIGIIPKGSTINIKSFKDCWIHHDKGWSLYQDENEMLIDLDEKLISDIKSNNKYKTSNKLNEIFLSTNDISLYYDINEFYSEYNIISKKYLYLDTALDSGLSYDDCIKNKLLPIYIDKAMYNKLLDIINKLKLVFRTNFNITINNMNEFKYNINTYIEFMNNNSISEPINPKYISENKKNRDSEENNTDNKSESTNLEESQTNVIDDESLGFLKDNGKDLEDISVKVKHLRGIFGVPYQYDNISDPSYEDDDNGIGWKFYSTYISRSPLLYLTPVRPKFMPGFSKDDKNNLLTAMFGGDESALSLFTNNSKSGARYFSTKFATTEYYNRFNTLARGLALYLGIGDISIPEVGGRLRNISCQKYVTSSSKSVSSFVGDSNTLVYYVEAIDSLSENHSNETTSSKLEGALNSASDVVNEVTFLVNSATGNTGVINGLFDGMIDGVSGLLAGLTEKFGVLGKRVSDAINTIAKGGKLILPEIWADSNFSFQGGNTFTIKLVAQNPCKLGWFFDIGLPYMSLVAMTAPHNIDNNAYTSPFLVKAYCKSSMSIDMGIITSLDIKKGDLGKWTVDGLPTEVEIEIEIKNLYSSLSISQTIPELSTNSFCLDYLANIAGININKPSFERAVELFTVGLYQSFSPRMFSRYIGLKLEEAGNNISMNVINWITGR